MDPIVTAIIIVIIVLILRSPAAKGRRSERAVARMLSASFASKGGRLLKNVYVPKSSGGTSEVDVVCITTKGIIVVENKNYAGYIFGNESNKNWTVTLYAGRGALGRKRVEKHQFYNPVLQNRTHINTLKDFLNYNGRYISIVTFSNRGSLKDVTVSRQNAIVCTHAELHRVLNDINDYYPDVLNPEQIEAFYNRLVKKTNVSASEKQRHILEAQNAAESLRSRSYGRPEYRKPVQRAPQDNTIVIPLKNVNNEPKESVKVIDTSNGMTETPQEIPKNIEEKKPDDICPRCGGKLVLRTAKRGPNAGKHFYGCSNYPKCRYISDIKD